MWHTQRSNRKDIDDAQWNRFAEASPQEYLYYHTWYLDAVAPDWEALFVWYGDRLLLQWPLAVSTKGPLRYCFQPRLTQFGGPVFAPM